jgi:hypothetical protein
MPWIFGAKKDVADYDKRRLGVNNRLTRRCPNGETRSDFIGTFKRQYITLKR